MPFTQVVVVEEEVVEEKSRKRPKISIVLPTDSHTHPLKEEKPIEMIIDHSSGRSVAQF